MSNFNPNDGNVRQPGGRDPDNWMRPDMTLHEISRLKELVAKERANYEAEKSKVLKVSEELQEAKLQMRKQKLLKKKFINKAKNTRAELERLKRYSDPETLRLDRIAALVHNTIKQKKKLHLRKDYEELQVAYTTTKERLAAELQKEKDKNEALQEVLEKMGVLYSELRCKNETEVFTARNGADNLQREVGRQIAPPDDMASQHEQFTANQRAEQEEKAHQTAVMQHASFEKAPASGRRHPNLWSFLISTDVAEESLPETTEENYLLMSTFESEKN